MAGVIARSRAVEEFDAFIEPHSCQEHPIVGTPMHPPHLPLENLDLAPQGQDFGLQLGLVTAAGANASSNARSSE